MSKLFKGTALVKTAAVLTAVTTVLSIASVAAAVAPSDYGLKEGWTISAAGSSDPDVYIVNDAGYKRLFLNPAIFGFYGHLGGFAAVHGVTPATRDAFMTSGLFRNCETNDQKVYGVEVTGEDTGTLHWVNTSGSQAVSDDPNFFSKVFCINNNEFNWYAKGADYSSVKQVPNYSRSGSQTTQTGGSFTVSLASDNPASGTFVQGQAAADLAHFMFSGNGTVNNLVLNRLGVSADTDLKNVYLYDGNKRLTDAATVTNGQISFNDTSSMGLFQVMGSKVISVRADLSSNTGETVGVQLASVNGNAVSVSGNLSTAANATLATAALANPASPMVAANTSLNPGSDVVGWQDTLTVGTRFIWLKSFQVRVIGSVQSGDLKNFRLFVDGVQVGSAVSMPDVNGYVFFDLGGGIQLQTGSRTVKVLLDVVNGSSRDFTLSVRQAPDVSTVDSQYGQNILTTVTTGSFPDSAGKQSITSGTLVITKRTDSPSGDVVKGASGVVLARYDIKAYGEKMKVESMRFAVDSSSGSVGKIRNGAIFLDGVQIGSTSDLLEEDNTSPFYTQYSFGSSFIVDPATPRVLEIRGDVYDNDGVNDIASGQTLMASIENSSSNVQRLTSLGYIDCAYGTVAGCTAGPIDGNSLTIRTGSVTVSKYSGYANQTVITPTYNTKLGHYALTQSSSEDLNVNSLNVSWTNGSSFAASNITNMYVKVWNNSGSLIYTSPGKSTISGTASNSYSVNFVLPKNQQYQVEVWGDVASGLSNNNYGNTYLDIDGVTTGSSTTVHGNGVAGQTETVQSGSLTAANGAIPSATLANGGSTVTAYSFTLQPAYDNYTLDEVYIDLSSTVASSVGGVANVMLYDGSNNLLRTAVLNSSTSSASFTGLNFSLPQSGGTKTFTVKAQLANVGVGANDTDGLVKVQLDGMKYHNSSGTVTTTTGLSTATYTGNNIVVVAAYPVVTNVSLPATLLATGNQSLFKAKIASSGSNTVRVYKLNWTVTETASTTLGNNGDAASAIFKVLRDGVDISSLGTFATASADLNAGGVTGAVAFTFTNEESIDSTGHVYELVGNVVATGSTPKSIVTKLANTTSSNNSNSASVIAGTLSTSSASITWSDGSQVQHSTTTGDWMSDYLVQSINQSQSMSL